MASLCHNGLNLSAKCATVYPKKYAHGFCFVVLCCGYTLTDFPISIRLTSLALWQSNDCPSASKATLMNMDKYFMWIHYKRLHNHNKAKHNKTVCIFLGIYCTAQKPSLCFLWFFSETCTTRDENCEECAEGFKKWLCKKCKGTMKPSGHPLMCRESMLNKCKWVMKPPRRARASFQCKDRLSRNIGRPYYDDDGISILRRYT